MNGDFENGDIDFTTDFVPGTMECYDAGFLDCEGNLVFSKEDISINNLEQGWDGNFKGKHSGQGVYAYDAVLCFVGGETERLTGVLNINSVSAWHINYSILLIN